MRAFLLVTALLCGSAYAQGNNDFQSLPNTSDLSALQATMNANAQRSDEFGGQRINLYPGMITPGSGASISAGGNTFTLPFGSPATFPSNWTGQVAMNGSLLLNGDYSIAMALVNGKILVEDAKGHGWVAFDPQTGAMSPASDPGWGGTGATANADPTPSPQQDAIAPATLTAPTAAVATSSCGLAAGAITAGSGSFADGVGNTYTIDAADGDAASINGAPVNDGAYRTSQLLMSSDGNIYGQDENTHQWFQLVSGGASWQPLTDLPTDGQSPMPTSRWDTAAASAGQCSMPQTAGKQNPATGMQNAASGPAPDILRVCSDPETVTNALNAALCAKAFQSQAQIDQIAAQISTIQQQQAHGQQ